MSFSETMPLLLELGWHAWWKGAATTREQSLSWCWWEPEVTVSYLGRYMQTQFSAPTHLQHLTLHRHSLPPLRFIKGHSCFQFWTRRLGRSSALCPFFKIATYKKWNLINSHLFFQCQYLSAEGFGAFAGGCRQLNLTGREATAQSRLSDC